MSAKLPGNYAPVKTGDSGFATQDFAGAPALASLPFEPKPVSVGMTVLWWANCNPKTEPIPCVVTKLHPRSTVTLGSWAAPGIVSDRPVRHSSDPLTTNPMEKVNGCWTYTAEYIAQQEQLARLASLMAAVSHLHDCVSSLAERLGESLPELSAEVAAAAGATETPIEPEEPEMTDEERKRKQEELLAALDQEGGELETENVAVPASERVSMSSSRRKRQPA